MDKISKKAKVSARDIRKTLIEIVTNGYYHIKSINNEIHSLGIKKIEEASKEDQQKLQALTLTLTLINDLIHPAHKMSKLLLRECEHPLIDYCQKAQKVAIETKLVGPCFCSSCEEDKKDKNEI